MKAIRGLDEQVRSEGDDSWEVREFFSQVAVVCSK